MGRYLKTAKSFAVEYSYLASSTLFLGAGTYIANATDADELGYGLVVAGITEGVLGTFRRLRGRKEERARQRKMDRMERRQRRMAEDLRELTEKALRDKGKKVRITMEVVDEMSEVPKDTDCKLGVIERLTPDNPSSSVEIKAKEFREYLDRMDQGADPGCIGMPPYPGEEI